MSRALGAEGRTVDTVGKPISDDVDLDALMQRVREAAMTGAAGGGTVQPQAAGAGTARELDLIRVLEAQGDWNEQARQALAALADCIRTLRDDWADERAGLRREIGQLSALVEQLRSATSPPAARPSSPVRTPSRTPRVAASPRGASKRRPAAKRRPRS
jgi:hypothetical protein